jgi:hypothetical protein
MYIFSFAFKVFYAFLVSPGTHSAAFRISFYHPNCEASQRVIKYIPPLFSIETFFSALSSNTSKNRVWVNGGFL